MKLCCSMLLICGVMGCANPPALPPADSAIQKGLAFLRESQQPDGFWGTGLETRGTEVYSMVPGSHDAYRVATTALCIMALREAGTSAEDKAAHDRALQWLIHHGEARRDDGSLMYNTWAHTYALQCLAIEMRENPDPRLKTAAQWHLDRLDRYQTHLGGWNYYDFKAHTQTPSLGPTSFGTAAGLVALYEAKQSGIDVPEKMIRLCIHRLQEMRTPEGAYLYGSDYVFIPRLPANRARGSVGRTQACNDALWLWGSQKMDEDQIRAGLELFFKEHPWIDMGRKRPFPHESWYQTSGYYYYFGHYHAARLIERLPKEDQKHFAPLLAGTILPHQEPDGSWWDYAMWDYHKPYGTAFALMSLVRIRPGLTESAGGG